MGNNRRIGNVIAGLQIDSGRRTAGRQIFAPAGSAHFSFGEVVVEKMWTDGTSCASDVDAGGRRGMVRKRDHVTYVQQGAVR
jgi:hypothetical protein